MNNLKKILERLSEHSFTETEIKMLKMLSVYHDNYDFLMGFAVGLKTDEERERLIKHIKAGGDTSESMLCLALLTIKKQRC